MEKDHPHIFEQFMLGNHTVRRIEKNWSGIWTDLSIEQSHVLKALKDNSMRDLFKASSQSNITIR